MAVWLCYCVTVLLCDRVIVWLDGWVAGWLGLLLHILIQTVGTLGYLSTPIRYVDSTGHKTIGAGFNLDASGAKTACESVGIDFAAVYAGTKVNEVTRL